MASKRSKKGTEVASSSRGKKRSAADTPNELGIIFKTNEQRVKYNSLENREVTTTRYPDFFTTLPILGLEDNVTMLFNNLGWMEFLSPERATFKALTLEFLSSLDLTEDGIVSFRMFNTDYKMNLYEFGNIIGFPNEGMVLDSKYPSERPVGYDRTEFWNQITGRPYYEARTAKATLVHNPVFRYIIRVMSCTICGRGEVGGVRTDELFLLWAMVHQVRVNTCKYIVNNLLAVSEKTQGDIVSGGMITFIAHKLGLGERLAVVETVQGNAAIDLEVCRKMFLARPANRNRTLFHLLVDKKPSFLLPNPERTDTRVPENWLYPDGAEEIPPEQPIQEEAEMNEAPVQADTEFNVQNEPEFNVQGEQNFNMQEWCLNMQAEQQRQAAEQQRQGAEQARIAGMLEAMMQHLHIQYPPPPPDHPDM